MFKTRNGRTVLDGGGVKPDVALPVDTAEGIVRALLEQDVIFDFATEYTLKHPQIDSVEIFEFTEFDEFVQYVPKHKFQYRTKSEIKLEELKALAEKEHLPLDADLEALERKIQAAKKEELARYKDRILHEIEQEIVGRYYFQRGKVRKNLVNDPEVKEAVRLLNDRPRYNAILAGR